MMMNEDLLMLNSYNHLLHQVHYFIYLNPLILNVKDHLYSIKIFAINLNNLGCLLFYESKIFLYVSIMVILDFHLHLAIIHLNMLSTHHYSNYIVY